MRQPSGQTISLIVLLDRRRLRSNVSPRDFVRSRMANPRSWCPHSEAGSRPMKTGRERRRSPWSCSRPSIRLARACSFGPTVDTALAPGRSTLGFSGATHSSFSTRPTVRDRSARRWRPSSAAARHGLAVAPVGVQPVACGDLVDSREPGHRARRTRVPPAPLSSRRLCRVPDAPNRGRQGAEPEAQLHASSPRVVQLRAPLNTARALDLC